MQEDTTGFIWLSYYSTHTSANLHQWNRFILNARPQSTFHAPLQQTREVHTGNRPTRIEERAQTRGHATTAYIWGWLSPIWLHVCTIKYEAFTQPAEATLFLNLTFKVGKKKSSPCPCLPLLRGKTSMAGRTGGITCLLTPLKGQLLQRIDSEMRDKLMKLPADE